MELSSYFTTLARPANRKLKDSCDLCSSSKVRCDKTKPACSRCASLGHPCSYSPARRAGRPHRIRPGSEKSHEPPSGLAGGVLSRREVPDPTSGSATGRSSSPLANSSVTLSQVLEEAAFLQGVQTGNHSLDNASCTTTITTTPQSAHGLLDTGEGGASFDCASAATSILEQLEVARRRSDFTTNTGLPTLTITEACQRLLAILVCPCSEKPLVALLLASSCISLVDTARDLSRNHSSYHGARAQDTTTSPEVPNTAAAARPGSVDSTGDLDAFARGFNWPMPPAPSSSSSSSLKSSPLHASLPPATCNSTGSVEELAKVAKVISQFTERYHCGQQGPNGGAGSTAPGPAGTGWAHTTWLLEPLIASLRLRLQSVTLEATERLVF